MVEPSLAGRVIAVTGTKGKSTTSTLTSRILQEAGFDAPRILAVSAREALAGLARTNRSTPTRLHALRLLHVIHDFLPRHRAGSELYVAALARALAAAPAPAVTIEIGVQIPMRDGVDLAADFLGRSEEFVADAGADDADILRLFIIERSEETSAAELVQIHVLRVSDAIQPSHPLSSPSPPAFNLS